MKPISLILMKLTGHHLLFRFKTTSFLLHNPSLINPYSIFTNIISSIAINTIPIKKPDIKKYTFFSRGVICPVLKLSKIDSHSLDLFSTCISFLISLNTIMYVTTILTSLKMHRKNSA